MLALRLTNPAGFGLTKVSRAYQGISEAHRHRCQDQTLDLTETLSAINQLQGTDTTLVLCCAL